MMEELEELESTLRQGQRLSMQGSYERRQPEADAIPFLTRARDGLLRFVDKNPNEARAWRSLSLAHECLLEYGAALAALREATRLAGGVNKRDLKRIAHLRAAAAEWSELPLSPAQLSQLGEYLRNRLGGGVGERTLRWTETWLRENEVSNPERVLEALRSRGGYTDFQVLCNVVG